MWCRRCEQDVPGLATPGKRGFACIRCGEKLESPQRVSEPPGDKRIPLAGEGLECASVVKPILSSPSEGCMESVHPSYEGIVLPISSFLSYDDWEMDEALRRIGRQVGKIPLHPAQTCSAQPGGRQARLDSPHDAIPQSHWGLSKNASRPTEGARDKKRPGLILYGGLMTLICGTVLLVWAYLTGREELQMWGWPCLILGQAGLLVGMFFQNQSKSPATLPKETPSLDATPPQEGGNPLGNLSSSQWVEQPHPFPPQPMASFHTPSYQTG